MTNRVNAEARNRFSVSIRELIELLKHGGPDLDPDQPLVIELRTPELVEGWVGPGRYQSQGGLLALVDLGDVWQLCSQSTVWFGDSERGYAEVALTECLRAFRNALYASSTSAKPMSDRMKIRLEARLDAIQVLELWADEVKPIGYGVNAEVAEKFLDQLPPVAIYSGLANSSKSTD